VTGAGPAPSQIESLAQAEMRMIQAAITACGGNIARSAALLGVNPSTLYRKNAEQGDGKVMSAAHAVGDRALARLAPGATIALRTHHDPDGRRLRRQDAVLELIDDGGTGNPLPGRRLTGAEVLDLLRHDRATRRGGA